MLRKEIIDGDRLVNSGIIIKYKRYEKRSTVFYYLFRNGSLSL